MNAPARRSSGPELSPADGSGVLVIDKPQGLTSHDVVASARRLLRERRIGHTGTLDPMATGVLPLAIGRATRLAALLGAADKEYEATIRFGVTTDTYDATGTETARSGAVPPRDDIARAIAQLTGSYLQQPPPFSAKKVAGRRAYALARSNRPVELAAVPVTVSRAVLLDCDDARARVWLTCSSGFYVRSFAHRMGVLTGSGACLEALRRTRSGQFTLEQALPLPALEDPARVAASRVPLEALLTDVPAVVVTARGREHVRHGRILTPVEYVAGGGHGAVAPGTAGRVRVLDAEGKLVALAAPGRDPGSLHPSVVLI